MSDTSAGLVFIWAFVWISPSPCPQRLLLCYASLH